MLATGPFLVSMSLPVSHILSSLIEDFKAPAPHPLIASLVIIRYNEACRTLPGLGSTSTSSVRACRHIAYIGLTARYDNGAHSFVKAVQKMYYKCRPGRTFIRELSAVAIIFIWRTNVQSPMYWVCGEVVLEKLPLAAGMLWVNEGKVFQHHELL